MNAARTGTNRSKAVPPPIYIKAHASVPSGYPSGLMPPKANARAIRMPPATTMGSMYETPVIRCLYRPVTLAARAFFISLARSARLGSSRLGQGQGFLDHLLPLVQGGFRRGLVEPLAGKPGLVNKGIRRDDDRVGPADFLKGQGVLCTHRPLRLDLHLVAQGFGGLAQSLGRHKGVRDAGWT